MEGREPLGEPANEEDRCRWLYPFFLEYCRAESGSLFLKNPPKVFSNQFAYLSKDLKRIRTTEGLARFKRLSTSEAKAAFLARAFALLERKASYSEQKMRKTRL